MKFWQKLRKSAAVLSCVAVMAGSGIAAAQVVTVDGYGADRSSAINDAKRTAVEQVVGSYLQSTTIINSSKVVLDDIYTHATGFVRDIDIVSEGKSNGQYHVCANIDISDELKLDAQRRLQTVASLNNPRIGIQLSGMNKGRKIANHYMKTLETEIVQYLLGKGITHIVILDSPASVGTDIMFANDMQNGDQLSELDISENNEMVDNVINDLDTIIDIEETDVNNNNLNMELESLSDINDENSSITDDNLSNGSDLYIDDNVNSSLMNDVNSNSSELSSNNEFDLSNDNDLDIGNNDLSDAINNADEITGVVFNVSGADNIQLDTDIQLASVHNNASKKNVDYILDGSLIVNSSSIRLPDYKDMAKAGVRMHDTGLMKVNMIFQGKLHHSDTGEVMGEVQLNTTAMDNTSEDAMLKGMGVLSSQIGEKVWGLFEQGSAIMPHSLTLSIKCKEYDKVLKLSERLRSQAGIQGVIIRDYVDGVATLSVDTEITPPQLFKIMKSYDNVFVTMEKQSDAMLEVSMG